MTDPRRSVIQIADKTITKTKFVQCRRENEC